MSFEGDFAGWNNEDAIRMSKPPVILNEENFYGDEKWIAKVRDSLTTHFPDGKSTRGPLFTTGPTASRGRSICACMSLSPEVKDK
jgi:hypothetical protein